MQPDRSSWWLCLPLLVLVTTLLPAAGLKDLVAASRAASVAVADMSASRSDQARPITPSPSFAAFNGGARHQNPQSRGIRLMDVMVCLACMALIMRPASRVWSQSAVATPGHASMLSQLRTQYLQL